MPHGDDVTWSISAKSILLEVFACCCSVVRTHTYCLTCKCEKMTLMGNVITFLTERGMMNVIGRGKEKKGVVVVQKERCLVEYLGLYR